VVECCHPVLSLGITQYRELELFYDKYILGDFVYNMWCQESIAGIYGTQRETQKDV